MKFEKFTVKAREAIADTQALGGKLGNPELRPQHLLMVLLTQDKGVVQSLLKHVGIPLDQFNREATRLLAGVEGIAQVTFTAEDVVRHDLVARIVEAYDRQALASLRKREAGE